MLFSSFIQIGIKKSDIQIETDSEVEEEESEDEPPPPPSGKKTGGQDYVYEVCLRYSHFKII